MPAPLRTLRTMTTLTRDRRPTRAPTLSRPPETPPARAALLTTARSPQRPPAAAPHPAPRPRNDGAPMASLLRIAPARPRRTPTA